jgi:hypothetical protein
VTDGIRDGLTEAVIEVAAGLPGVDRVDGPAHGLAELRRDGRAFIRVESGAVHFRLDPSIAAAARRTAGVSASDAGPGWVAFRPSSLDRFSLDRASAWTALAWRLAEVDEPGRT